MIKVKNLVPDVYYKESRDFQVLGRTYEALFNYLKNEVDMIESNPLSANSDERLLDLLSLTLGFKSKHNYNHRQLKAMCYSLAEILRYKGTKKAIELAIKVLMQAENVKAEAEIDVDPEEGNINVYLSEQIGDLNLFNDLLEYILPAGMSCLVYKSVLEESNASTVIPDQTSSQTSTPARAITWSCVPTYDPDDNFKQTAKGAIDNSVVVQYDNIYQEE